MVTNNKSTIRIVVVGVAGLSRGMRIFELLFSCLNFVSVSWFFFDDFLLRCVSR